MRSQTTKPLPKKGALSKTTFKATSPIQQTKKKVLAAKKITKVGTKPVIKTPKKNLKEDSDNKNESESSSSEKSSDSSEKAGCSKARSESPSKKIKKDTKELKDSQKTSSEVSKSITNKNVNPVKKTKKSIPKKKGIISDEIKYKLNSDVIKKVNPKSIKAKKVPKKGNQTVPKKKSKTNEKSDITELNKEGVSEKDDDKKCSSQLDIKNDETGEGPDKKIEKTVAQEKPATKTSSTVSVAPTLATNINTQNPAKLSSYEALKIEPDRPPKFFTTSRSPRTVDIDVKCLKNAKGNLSVSERFLSMKCVENKDEESNEKNISLNTLVSPGPEIDVYTFTEKVDSPKSILSDFRDPINKNIGRVRPIARVKGTIIDKKGEIEKKKYSPHRPIEEVVKQLKAKKGSEEQKLNPDLSSENRLSVDSNVISDEKEEEDKPKPIVSKSYKMVARKTSIPGKPFSPIKFLEQEDNTKSNKNIKSAVSLKKNAKSKSKSPKSSMSDEEIDNSKFSINKKSKQRHYSSSDDSVVDSNDDNDTKESSDTDTSKNKKTKKTKKYKRITDCIKKSSSKELKELSKDSLIDLKDESLMLGNEKPSKRRLKLISMWTGPKKHRMASLNARAKVHCLYENESRTHMELGLMKTVDRSIMPGPIKKKEEKVKEAEGKRESTSESEYERKSKKEDSSEDDMSPPSTRTLRGVPGIRSAGKYWDPKSSTSSSEDSELEYKKKASQEKKKSPAKLATTSKSQTTSDSDKPPLKIKKTVANPVKKKRNRNEVVMDLKDMVVQKRMASLNATAILAASYEKRSPKSSKDETTSDSCSDESFSRKPKNGVGSGVKSETKIEEPKKEVEDPPITDKKQKVEVVVNQDTDVTITGVYSTHHHEGFCTVSGMQYRISSTSHTQTTATANCEKEGCSREDGTRYAPLSALSSMQPPAEHTHQQPVPELGGLARRAAGCSSAFSAPTAAAQHHEPGYYQPAGPLIKESSADADRTLARYHPPHYHAPHPPVIQQYGPSYYSTDLCYGRYYRPPGPYHMPPPPQPDSQMVGVGSEPYPPPQYYGGPPCYQHSPQRVPYIEYRGCPCPMNACPKNVHIGPATGKAPTGGGPDVPPALAPPGGAFRAKVRAACALDGGSDAHGSGKDPPLEPEPPAAADAPRPCPLPNIGGASPKRELYDVRDNSRLVGDMSGSVEAVGPPSPARGSAGACAPQPPPIAPRRARLGKAMARRSLAGDDTGLLLNAPQASTQSHSDADDDVLAISPPACAPIDLSSSDETERRSTPLVDVKKENEGPTNALPRKTDAQALKEHNSALGVNESNAVPVKRRYSKPKLEIDLGDVNLDEGCRTNGIGEHVKLQKRRKISSEQSDLNRTETTTGKESKKKITKAKRQAKQTTTPKKAVKRKATNNYNAPQKKKLNLDKQNDQDLRHKDIAALPQENALTKPKNKSALLLDNLLRKNSIDRPDTNTFASDSELSPADLFLSTKEKSPQTCIGKTLNINNNVIDNSVSTNGVRPKTIAAVSQMIEKKKAASKNILKSQKVEGKVNQNLNIANLLTDPELKETKKSSKKLLKTEQKKISNSYQTEEKPIEKLATNNDIVTNSLLKSCNKLVEIKSFQPQESNNTKEPVSLGINDINEKSDTVQIKQIEFAEINKPSLEDKPEKVSVNRSKLSIDKTSDLKAKNDKGSIEKVVKLLVSKKSVIKTDEAALLVEDACASPIPVRPNPGKRSRRRRSGPKKTRRIITLLPPPLSDDSRAPPRWSNGWQWDGDHHVAKVYLNNDARQDRAARCWSRMSHMSGDRVSRGDCVLLRASSVKAQPFVARVARLWENPDDGEMMVSLVWYYRPEHTERGRTADDAPDEVFASRHRDVNSVACIEDKCYVLTFNEYCRYRKRLKAAEEGLTIQPSIVPPMPAHEVVPAIATNDSKLPPSISPELVLFCRKIYDFRSKKIQVPNK